eukprot:9450801-Pyramimonas_sp.AAC.1
MPQGLLLVLRGLGCLPPLPSSNHLAGHQVSQGGPPTTAHTCPASMAAFQNVRLSFLVMSPLSALFCTSRESTIKGTDQSAASFS